MINVLNCLHRSDFGGAHWRVVHVSNILKLNGIQTRVLYPQDTSTHYEQVLEENSVKFTRFNFTVLRRRKLTWLLFFFSLPWAVFRITKVIKRYNINVLHVNGVTNIQPLLAGIAKGIPVLWHWNDMLTPHVFVKIAKLLAKNRLVKIAVATSAIIEYYDLQLYEPAIVPAPVDLQASDVKESTNLYDLLTLGKECKIIGCVGHLVAEKGIEDFLIMSIKLLNQFPSLHAVIIGGALDNHSDFHTSIKNQIADSDVGTRIHLLGYRDDVSHLMSQLDLYVMSSWSEACPITVLEAMSKGVPIVATKVGEVPQMLFGSGCSLVEARNPDALYEGVLRMLSMSSKKRKSISERLMENVKTYSLDNVAKIHLSLYRKLLR